MTLYGEYEVCVSWFFFLLVSNIFSENTKHHVGAHPFTFSECSGSSPVAAA